jgi:hypothetical protein
VKTASGLVPIEAVPVGSQVWSRSGWKTVLNNFDNGLKPTYLVKTDRGLTLSVTGGHRFRVLNAGRVTWAKAKDLTPQDFVLADFGTRPFPERTKDQQDAAYRLGVSVGKLGRLELALNIEGGLPNAVLQGSQEVVTAFLRGLWGAGGVFDSRGTASFTQRSAIIGGLQLLMLDLGIDCVTTAFTLKVRSCKGREAFAQIIGFEEKLKVITPSPAKYFKSDRWPTGTMPQRVVSVTLSGRKERVYDLEVTGDHEYATGGLLSHNCEKSADTITTTYLDDTHREQGTTLFCNLKNRDNPLFQPFLANVHFASRRIHNGISDNTQGNGLSVDDIQLGFDDPRGA